MLPRPKALQNATPLATAPGTVLADGRPGRPSSDSSVSLVPERSDRRQAWRSVVQVLPEQADSNSDAQLLTSDLRTSPLQSAVAGAWGLPPQIRARTSFPSVRG